MKRIIHIISIAALLICAACDGAIDYQQELGISPSAAEDPLTLDGEVISCVDASDCAVVELSCCDHCNGGFAVAVNFEYESEVAERNSEACDADELCTEMACPALFPRCITGDCAYSDEVAIDWQGCATDDDCIVVELGCCDHCNGGYVVATNTLFAEEVIEEMSDVCEEDHPCTLMACPEELPRCEEGICTHYPDPEFGP